MRNTKSSTRLRMTMTAGWTAVKSAFVGSIGFSVCVMGIGLLSVGIDGIYALTEPDPFLGLPSAILSIVVILIPTFAVSILPAFLGGIFVAYVYNREASKGSLTINAGVRIATLTGLAEGIILAAIFSPIIFWLAMHPAHGMPPPPFGYAILSAAVFALPIIIMAWLVSFWTGKQIVNYFVT